MHSRVARLLVALFRAHSKSLGHTRSLSPSLAVTCGEMPVKLYQTCQEVVTHPPSTESWSWGHSKGMGWQSWWSVPRTCHLVPLGSLSAPTRVWITPICVGMCPLPLPLMSHAVHGAEVIATLGGRGAIVGRPKAEGHGLVHRSTRKDHTAHSYVHPCQQSLIWLMLHIRCI